VHIENTVVYSEESRRRESLSPEQAAEAARLRNSGGRFVVVYSLDDLIEAIRRIEAASTH
jgi:hypothetical protein